MRIGFLGGTGIEAMGLAVRFAAAGFSVCLGSRAPERALQAAAECAKKAGAPLVRGADNEEMIASSDIIFITLPFREAPPAAERYRDLFKPHHVLVDVTVPLEFRSGQPEYVDQEGRSNSEIIAAALPGNVPLTAAFKTIPAHLLADLESGLDCSVFICGDSEPAKARLIAAASRIPSLHPLDAGPLRAAGTLERMAVLAIALNRRYKKKVRASGSPASEHPNGGHRCG